MSFYRAAGGKMVGVSAETEKSLADQLERIDRIYAAKGVDMTSFPSFSFSGESYPLPPTHTSTFKTDENFLNDLSSHIKKSFKNYQKIPLNK